jgi:hypothetical protein
VTNGLVSVLLSLSCRGLQATVKISSQLKRLVPDQVTGVQAGGQLSVIVISQHLPCIRWFGHVRHQLHTYVFNCQGWQARCFAHPDQPCKVAPSRYPKFRPSQCWPLVILRCRIQLLPNLQRFIHPAEHKPACRAVPLSSWSLSCVR